MSGFLSRAATFASNATGSSSGKTYMDDKSANVPLSASTVDDYSGRSSLQPEKADWKERASTGAALVLLLIATGLLGYAVFQGNETTLAKGTMSWSLKGAADAINNVIDKGQEVVESVAQGGEEAVNTVANGGADAANTEANGAQDVVGKLPFVKRYLARLLPRADSSDTWKFSLTLDKLTLDEADDWPKTIEDSVWAVAKNWLPYVKQALTTAFALTVLVSIMQIFTTLTTCFSIAFANFARHPIYTKLASIFHFCSFILVLIVFLVISAIQSAVPMLTFDTEKSDLPFVTASFEADKPDRKLVQLLAATLAVMAVHWIFAEGIQQMKECYQGRNPPCSNCGQNPKVRYATRDEEKTAEY